MMDRRSFFFLYLLWKFFPQLTQSLSSNNNNNIINNSIHRRHVISGILSSTPFVLGPTNPVFSLSPPQEGIQGTGGKVTRVEGIGGGFDLTNSVTTKGVDVIYPSSLEGAWKCRRVVTSVEGDVGQAEIAWRNLGGMGRFYNAKNNNNNVANIESFETSFLRPSDELHLKNEYVFEGEKYKGVILDRGSEIKSRSNGQYEVSWSMDSPDILTYKGYDGKDETSIVEVAVVQRKVELPNEKGFGYDELYRITSSAGGIFGSNKVQRAVRVKRRYRRDVDGDGNRIVEGLEVMKTYRVLDGIAGVEMPTSTTKSMMKLRRI